MVRSNSCAVHLELDMVNPELDMVHPAEGIASHGIARVLLYLEHPLHLLRFKLASNILGRRARPILRGEAAHDLHPEDAHDALYHGHVGAGYGRLQEQNHATLIRELLRLRNLPYILVHKQESIATSDWHSPQDTSRPSFD